jgi:hypothetical protein
MYSMFVTACVDSVLGVRQHVRLDIGLTYHMHEYGIRSTCIVLPSALQAAGVKMLPVLMYLLLSACRAAEDQRRTMLHAVMAPDARERRKCDECTFAYLWLYPIKHTNKHSNCHAIPVVCRGSCHVVVQKARKLDCRAHTAWIWAMGGRVLLSAVGSSRKLPGF